MSKLETSIFEVSKLATLAPFLELLCDVRPHFKNEHLFQTASFSAPIRSFSTILDALESSHRALFKTSRIFDKFLIGAENDTV